MSRAHYLRVHPLERPREERVVNYCVLESPIGKLLAAERDGALEILDPSGETGTLPAGGAPLDAHFDRSGRLLFVLDSANDAIVTFSRDAQGGLTLLPSSLPLPPGAAGLIAR